MGRNWSKLLVIAIWWLSNPLHGWAETSFTPPRTSSATEQKIHEEALYLKEETVSIASRYEQPISESPSNVYVITDEDIRMSGATDLPTILRRIPGLEVMQMSGAEFNVSARGNNQPLANKLLVMVDGRSIYVDAQGLTYWKLLPITLPEIKRIEVLKGPASAVYGFNTFDGIISITTKSAEEMRGATLQFGGGAVGTLNGAAVYANVVNKLGYRLSVGHDQQGQWRNRDALAFRSNKFNISTEYALTADSRLAINGGLADANQFDGNIGESTMNAGSPSQRYASIAYERPHFFLRANWTGFFDSTDVMFNPLVASFLKLFNLTGEPLSRNDTQSNTYNLEAQHSLALTPSNLLTYGANYRRNTLDHRFISQPGREDRFGVYLQDEWSISHSFSLLAGARYDLHSEINGTWSPRASLLYKLTPNHVFRIGLSVAYRPPTVYESLAAAQVAITLPPPATSPPPTISRGSSNLDPERIISYELGYQGWFLAHRLRLRGNLFFNHITDLINVIPLSPGVASYVNIPGQADIYGGEVGMETLFTEWLSGFANVTYQDVGQSFIDTSRRGVPHWLINAGLRGNFGTTWSGELLFHHVASTDYPLTNTILQLAPLSGMGPPNQTVGSYNLLNLRLGYRFWQQEAVAGYRREAEVALSVFNALNDNHREHPLGDLLGTRVMGWLTLKL
jgi:iron complex outermembrane recepter protein